jgi:hypothetical protein
VPWSSQAFCLSVWGTVGAANGHAVRQVIADVLPDPMLTAALLGGPPKVRFEHVNRELLNEKGTPKATHLDVVLSFPSVVAVVESKLTERLGGCSQVKARHCSGTYGPGSDRKTGDPTACCRLEIQDGRRTPRSYWTVMRALSRGPVATRGHPCPFRKGGFQVMRNIASASRLGDVVGTPWRAIFALSTSASAAGLDEIRDVAELLSPNERAKVLTLNYDDLVSPLTASSDLIAQGLGHHIRDRVATARSRNAR